MLKYLRNIYPTYLVIRAIAKYGPDAAEAVSRDMSFDALAERTLINWQNEGMRLLPRRYEHILLQLHTKGLLTQDEYSQYKGVAHMSIWGSSIFSFSPETKTFVEVSTMFPWEKDPAIMGRIPEPLLARIEEFKKDHKVFEMHHEACNLLMMHLAQKVMQRAPPN